MKAINRINGNNGTTSPLPSGNGSTSRQSDVPGVYQIELSDQEFFIFEALQLLEESEYRRAKHASATGRFTEARSHIKTAGQIIDLVERLNSEIDFY